MSLPAKAAKSLSHRFPSVARHRIYPTHLNTVRNDSGASFLRNGISSQGQGQILLQVAPENINYIQWTNRILKKTSHHFCPGTRKRKNRGRTHSHTVSTFLFQHERLRGSKCPHLPQDKPKNDSTKSKTPKNRSGRFASLRAGCRESTASFPQIRFPENRGRDILCIGRKRRRKSGRPRYVS